MRTSVPGVFVLKLPVYKSSPTRLAAELNPVDEGNKPKKRRGLILRSNDKLSDFKNLFQHLTIPKLFDMLDKVNPKLGLLSQGNRKKF